MDPTAFPDDPEFMAHLRSAEGKEPDWGELNMAALKAYEVGTMLWFGVLIRCIQLRKRPVQVVGPDGVILYGWLYHGQVGFPQGLATTGARRAWIGPKTAVPFVNRFHWARQFHAYPWVDAWRALVVAIQIRREAGIM